MFALSGSGKAALALLALYLTTQITVHLMRRTPYHEGMFNE